jgi:hypothetical protein
MAFVSRDGAQWTHMPVIVDIDDSRPDLPRTQREPEKASGRNQIPVRRQPEINRVSGWDGARMLCTVLFD